MATSMILYMKDCGKAFHGKHLKVALEYISAPEKTQDGRLISGINCIPEFAFEQMKETKKKYLASYENTWEYTLTIKQIPVIIKENPPQHHP